jgi:hypothetical protein
LGSYKRRILENGLKMLVKLTYIRWLCAEPIIIKPIIDQGNPDNPIVDEVEFFQTRVGIDSAREL